MLGLASQVKAQGSYFLKVVPVVIDCVRNPTILLLYWIMVHPTHLSMNLWSSHINSLWKVLKQSLFA